MQEKKYFPINESNARSAHNMMSMRDYVEGSTTADYHSAVNKAYELADKVAEKKPEEAPAPAAPVEAAPEPEEDSLELIAVITAAVAAAMGTSAASIQVRSYKKLDGGAWNRAGRREVLENRF